MKSRLIALLFLFSSASLKAEEEILVQLATHEKLTPLYIGKLAGDISSERLAQLQSVLEYDFKYNGRSHLLPKSSEKEARLKMDERYARKAWSEMGVAHLITGYVSHGRLTLAALNVQTGTMKTFKEILLTGDLSVDRRQIHLAADAIHKAFFNAPGIASSRILYSYYVPGNNPHAQKWVAEIWECDYDGANARQVTHEGNYCVSPVYLPYRGGEGEFLYVSYKQGQPKIFHASLGDGKGTRLVDLRGNQLLPAVTKDCEKIAFICDAGGRADLFMQTTSDKTQAQSKPIQLFSFPRSTQASPTFSPDGLKIAFVSDKSGTPRIYIIDAKSAKKRQEAKLLTKRNRESSCPAWSPDGRKLAYSSKVDRVRQIWIYDFEKDEEVQLTAGPGNKENPSWAPDSLHLVFNSVGSTSSELYIVNINQPDAIQITKGAGKKHYPSWGASKRQL